METVVETEECNDYVLYEGGKKNEAGRVARRVVLSLTALGAPCAVLVALVERGDGARV